MIELVVVTGAFGYLGGAIVEAFVAAGAGVRRVGRRRGGPAPASARVEDVVGDVRDATLWPSLLEGADVVVHLAAQTSAYVAEDDPEADRVQNVEPVMALLDACRRSGRRPAILLAGTATQVGVPRHLPVDESVPDEPVTVYDRHKLLAERALEQAVHEGVVRGACLRLANVYGPGAASRNPDRGVLNRMVQRAIQGEPLTVYRGYGGHTRDYVYIEDVVRAFLAAAERPDGVAGRHFVIGSGQGRTVAGAVELVADRVALKTGRRPRIEEVDPPRPLLAIEERSFVADSSAFTRATGWRAVVELQEGIDRTIAWGLAGQGAVR